MAPSSRDRAGGHGWPWWLPDWEYPWEHRNEAQNLDPMGKPEGPEPWYQLDPEEALDPWDESEEPSLLTLPMTIGPAPDGPAGPASGVDLETGLMAAELHWKT